MNNLVYIGSLCPGEEFFYRGKPGNTKQNDLEKAIQYIKKEIEIQKVEDGNGE